MLIRGHSVTLKVSMLFTVFFEKYVVQTDVNGRELKFYSIFFHTVFALSGHWPVTI